MSTRLCGAATAWVSAGLALFLLAMPAASSAQQRNGDGSDGAITYKPPIRGAPARRSGGSSRGGEGALPDVFVFAPDHVGLTAVERPALYWYLSGPTRVRVELTLIDEKGVAPVLEAPVEPAPAAGVQGLRLRDFDVGLKPGVEYQWSVSLVPNERERSNDVQSSGVIMRVAAPAELREQLAATKREARPALLAGAGYWYDAISELSELIEANPGNSGLREQRARLLEQVGLRDAAAYDRRQH